MASFLLLNGRISSHFDIIRLKLPTHTYFVVLSHSMWSKYKILKFYFYDVITMNSIPSCATELSVAYQL